MVPIAPPVSSTKFWQPGKGGCPTIFERDQILGIIGQGGMGTVFKGYHVNLKRFVAIKTLRIGTNHGPALLDRFRREMEVIGQMDHPNVVRATDAGEKNGVFYLVMEHLTGLDLSHLVARQGPLGVADACELTRQAALGLSYIHQTLVHRDIKPSNLMLTTSGLVKVLDLGLARPGFGNASDGELTPQGCAVGTFAYIAPEQASANGAIDGRADIYSLGCTLYKLLTNQTPFSGPEYDSPAKQIHAHGHVPLTAVSGFSAIPDALKPLLFQMMAKDPADRFPSAQEVANALTPFAAGNQYLRLLADASGGMLETPVRPLSEPFPEDLSRLTVAPVETSHSGVPVTERIDRPKPKRSWRRIGLIFGIGVLAVGLAGLGWSFFPNPQIQGDPKQAKGPEPARISGLRAMDGPAHLFQKLLDERPVPVGGEDALSGQWRWDKPKEVAIVDGPDPLLLQLGTTSRGRFIFKAAITQNPWTGQVGIFWGYRENTDLKANKKPNQEFAWFQFIMVKRLEGQDILSLQRGKANLKHDGRGKLLMNTAFLARQDVPARFGGEKILAITADDNRLISAMLDADHLPDLCSEAANKFCEFAPSQGAFGFFTMRHSASFREAYFMAK